MRQVLFYILFSVVFLIIEGSIERHYCSVEPILDYGKNMSKVRAKVNVNDIYI